MREDVIFQELVLNTYRVVPEARESVMWIQEPRAVSQLFQQAQ